MQDRTAGPSRRRSSVSAPVRGPHSVRQGPSSHRDPPGASVEQASKRIKPPTLLLHNRCQPAPDLGPKHFSTIYRQVVAIPVKERSTVPREARVIVT